MTDGHLRAERLGLQTLARHSRSFSLAGALLPARCRREAAVLYTWCRTADDAVDLGPADPLSAVSALRRDLDAVYAGARLRDPMLAAFQDVVGRRGIPRFYPEELLAGMAMDAEGRRYQTTGDLLGYCYRVAGTVGLMMGHVMGVADPRALRNAAHLGIAMQLTNICRDVVEDAARGRLYLPRDVLQDAGGGWVHGHGRGPLPEVARPALAASARRLLALADRYYRAADDGFGALRWRCGLSARAARLFYRAIGQEIGRRGYDVLLGRAMVPTRRRAFLLAAAAWSAARAGAGAGRHFRPAPLRDVLVRADEVVLA